MASKMINFLSFPNFNFLKHHTQRCPRSSLPLINHDFFCRSQTQESLRNINHTTKAVYAVREGQKCYENLMSYIRMIVSFHFIDRERAKTLFLLLKFKVINGHCHCRFLIQRKKISKMKMFRATTTNQIDFVQRR